MSSLVTAVAQGKTESPLVEYNNRESMRQPRGSLSTPWYVISSKALQLFICWKWTSLIVIPHPLPTPLWAWVELVVELHGYKIRSAKSFSIISIILLEHGSFIFPIINIITTPTENLGKRKEEKKAIYDPNQRKKKVTICEFSSNFFTCVLFS